jgi:hypothetical protein
VLAKQKNPIKQVQQQLEKVNEVLFLIFLCSFYGSLGIDIYI